tara:strand:- start:4427 stop:6403 length:1977 start_codon:yes stop_codon:yes gene_type:complete
MCTNSLLEKGINCLQNSDLKKSRIIFESILVSDSNNPVAIHFLGVAKAQSGDIEDGLKLMRLSTKLNPKKYSFSFNLANLLYSVKRYEEALEAALASIKIKPESAESWELIESILSEANGYTTANKVSLDTCILLKNLEENIIDYASYLYSKKRYKCSVEVFQYALQKLNLREGSWMKFGKLMVKIGDLENAINAYKLSIHINKKNVDALIHLAQIELKLKRESEAQNYLEKAIGIEKHNSNANYLLAESYYNSGDLLKSKLCWEKITEYDPSNYKAHYNLGSLNIELGEFKDAVKSLEKVIKLNPDLHEAYIKLSKVWRKMHDLEKGVEVLQNLEAKLYSNQVKHITVNSYILVLDAYARRARVDLWKLEVAKKFQLEARQRLERNDHIHIMKMIKAKFYPEPSLQQNHNDYCSKDKFLKDGYRAYNKLLPTEDCEKLIDQFSKHNNSREKIISILKVENILEKVLNPIICELGTPCLIWNYTYSKKSSSEQTVSDTWHYDNHYAEFMMKIIIYLNSQIDSKGATDFLSAKQSEEISSKTSYIGMINQRNKCAEYMKKVSDHNLTEYNKDSSFYRFSPDQAGSAILFKPAKVLHRGKKPEKASRYTLTFTLIPLFANSKDWTNERCITSSLDILRTNEMNGLASDGNPYWIVNENRV